MSLCGDNIVIAIQRSQFSSSGVLHSNRKFLPVFVCSVKGHYTTLEKLSSNMELLELYPYMAVAICAELSFPAILFHWIP